MIKPEKLVMIPGPTPVVRSIQDQMGRDTVAFKDSGFVQDFSEVLADLKTLWKCDGEVFVVAGSGTLAMEMAIANTTKRGDSVLICSNGYFGDRFIDMCERKGLDVDVLSAQWGSSVTPEMVEAKLKEKRYDAVTVTHAETSTGAMAPIGPIGEVMKKYPDTIYIVDAVAAAAGIEEYMVPMGIDVILTCSQKAFGVAPGLGILWASKKAMQRRESLGKIPESYIDFDKWLPVMHDPSKYWGTPPINMIWAFKEAIRIIKEEGIEERYDRHSRQATMVDSAMEALGFEVAAEKEFRAPTLSVYKYPEGSNADDAKFRSVLGEEGVAAAGCLGEYKDIAFRMGHMGNISKHTLVSTIAAVERACVKTGINVKLGSGLAVLQEGLAKE